MHDQILSMLFSYYFVDDDLKEGTKTSVLSIIFHLQFDLCYMQTMSYTLWKHNFKYGIFTRFQRLKG